MDEVHGVYDWFLEHPHLRQYVRHIEFWVPIWQRRGGARDIKDPSSTTLIDMAVDLGVGSVMQFGPPRNAVQPLEPISEVYCLSSRKSTLEELFDCVASLFQTACILTIEGGHCKRSPMIDFFRHGLQKYPHLAPLPGIQTLILRGTWNIIREPHHFQAIAAALPSLKEWHSAYTKPKVGGYRSMYKIVQQMPPAICRLNLSLDGFYSSKSIDVDKFQDVMKHHHLCKALGAVLPRFEAVTMSGRFCKALFEDALQAAKGHRDIRLKSVDLVVKNCCRPKDQWNDGAGYNNWGFICAFEELVVAATAALSRYKNLNYLRIRFVDLDAPCPLLNPYFHMTQTECTGIWNEEILSNVTKARMRVVPVDLDESFDTTYATPGPTGVLVEYPTRRPKSIKVASYAAFSDASVL